MTSNKRLSSMEQANHSGHDQDKAMEVDDDEEMELEEGGNWMDDVYIPPPPPPPAFCGDETGVRLVIQKIDNINFKSYAGKQTLGPFHKSFTSIVGPNGSGKSNVIDSMLFVFGYRAQKLRSKKLSILIHNSEAYKSLDFCRVNVHFALINDQPGEDFEVVDESQFVVSRVANKDNSAYYLINDRRVQFKEVSSLLQHHGIDLRYNRFLILQGEVEQIALMKPKADNEHESGMLEFLEDIIGSARLKEPLAQFALKVEEANEMRAEKMNRVRVVEKELKSLEEAKNEAIKFLETQNEVALLKSKLFQIHKSDAKEGAEEARKEYDRAKEILDKAMEEINKLVKDREEKEKELKELQKEHADIKKSAEELKGKYEDCERRDMQLREKLKNIKAKGKKLDTDLENENKKLENLKKQPEKLAKDIEELEDRKGEEEAELKKAEEKLFKVMGEIKADTEQLQKRKDELEAQLLELQKDVNEARHQRDIAQSELDLYLQKEKNEQAKLDQFNFKLSRAVNESQSKRSALAKFDEEIPTTEGQIRELDQELAKLDAKRVQLVEEHRSKSARVQEMHNSAAQFKSQNRVLNALMDQKKRGNLKGIFGRLGDLGAIDKKYDVAISTACGRLDNILTDTLETATECVDFLKKNNVGQATFITLERMSHNWDERTFPEGVPRLFDLVRVNDPRVRPAFYFALGNTLVANDLNQASRIAYGRERHRVVTLDGQLIETSGAMSGGGRPMSGRMGSSVAVNEVDSGEVERLEREVATISGKLQELKDRHDQLKRERDQLEKDSNQMKSNKPQFEMEVKRFDELQNTLKKSVEEQQAKVAAAKPDPKQAKELDAKLKAEEKRYLKEAQKTEEIEEEVGQLNDKIKEIMDKKVGRARKDVDSLKEKNNKTNSDLAKVRSSLTTAERNIKKAEDKIKSMDEERNELLEQLSTTKQDIKKLEEEATEVSKNYEEASNKEEESVEKMKQIQAKINKTKAEETKLNSENVDARHEVEQQNTKLKEKELEVKKWDDQLATLEFHEIEGRPKVVVSELTKEELDQLNSHAVNKEIERHQQELTKMKPNMSAIGEYKKKEAVYIERSKELEEATQRRDRYKESHETIRQQRLNEFKDGFVTISRKLKEMYRMITLGGDAELEYNDSLDPFSEGIIFNVRPNKKSWKKISNLSGGEKTLSSLALIFALHYFKPSPLYVMDEIDAALDFKNVSIVANYIKQRTRNTQFIIISLRNNMYEMADRLVGIYKTHNCTKSVTLNPNAVEEKRVDRRTVTLSTVTEQRLSQEVGGGQHQSQGQGQSQGKSRSQRTGDGPTGSVVVDDSVIQATGEGDCSVFVN